MREDAHVCSQRQDVEFMGGFAEREPNRPPIIINMAYMSEISPWIHSMRAEISMTSCLPTQERRPQAEHERGFTCHLPVWSRVTRMYKQKSNKKLNPPTVHGNQEVSGTHQEIVIR